MAESWIVEMDGSAAPPRPLPRADLKVGFACNNRCVFCAQGDRRATCGAVDVDVLEQRLASARSRSRGLVLTGGEPTVYKHLVRLVRTARRLGYAPIQVQTNGRMLAYRNIVDALRLAGVHEFSPSLHGSTAEAHDALTRAPGSFAQSALGIANAVASGASVVTNSVVVRDNVDDLPALVAKLASLGVRHAQLAFVHPVGTARDGFDAVVPRLSDVEASLRRAHATARAAGVRLVTEAVPLCFLRDLEEVAVEPAIPSTLVLDFDGAAIDYSAWREGEGKTHGAPCARCSARTRCEGPWREYPERHGWDEFQPLP